MKKKSTLCLLILGLLILVLVLAACGRTSASGDRVKTIPHSVGWGFTNCLVCHSGGDLALPAAFHPTNPTNEECQNPGCHSVATSTQTIITLAKTTTTPTTTPPATTTATPTTTTEPPTTTTPSGGAGPISYDNHYIYTDASSCFVCHMGAAPVLANPEDHADYAIDSCLDADCHELSEPE